jgi:hypothetical protein
MEKAAIQLGASSDFRLFSSMITSKPFAQIMKKGANSKKRLGKAETKEELDYIL